MWENATINGTKPKLVAAMDGIPMGLLGVSSCNEPDHWRYYIAVASSQPIDDTLQEEYMVPAATWAMDDWLIIDKIEDVVVGTSIPYNYDRSRF